jgi:hypothetical protein
MKERKPGPRHSDRVRARNPHELKDLRVSRCSQGALAESAGINQRIVERLEQGLNVKRWNAEPIAKVLDKDFDYLFVSVYAAGTQRIDFIPTPVEPGMRSDRSFSLSIDGIILNHVGELIFERASERTIQNCSRSYQRSLEDFAFALLYGTQITSKWQPKTQQTDKPTAATLGPAETLISKLPEGLYGFESFDADLRDGALLKNRDDLGQIRGYLVCVAQCMNDPRFVELCKELLVREAELFLKDDPSLFKDGGGPHDYKFGKPYYRHQILDDMPTILGNSTIETLIGFLPEGPVRKGKKKIDVYARSALYQFVIQVMLTHFTTMYEFEKNSQRHRRRRVPYALRSAVTLHMTKTDMQRHLQDIVVCHALSFALGEASGTDKKESIVRTLQIARNLSPFNEIREMLAELDLIALTPDAESEKRASEMIKDIWKIKLGSTEPADRVSLARSSVLRHLAKADPREYDRRLYTIFPELRRSHRLIAANTGS